MDIREHRCERGFQSEPASASCRFLVEKAVRSCDQSADEKWRSRSDQKRGRRARLTRIRRIIQRYRIDGNRLFREGSGTRVINEFTLTSIFRFNQKIWIARRNNTWMRRQKNRGSYGVIHREGIPRGRVRRLYSSIFIELGLSIVASLWLSCTKQSYKCKEKKGRRGKVVYKDKGRVSERTAFSLPPVARGLSLLHLRARTWELDRFALPYTIKRLRRETEENVPVEKSGRSR